MAIDQFMKQLKVQPDQSDAYDGLGWAYLAQQRELEARSAFKMAIRLEPLNNSAHKGLRKAKEGILEKRLSEKTKLSANSPKTNPN